MKQIWMIVYRSGHKAVICFPQIGSRKAKGKGQQRGSREARSLFKRAFSVQNYSDSQAEYLYIPVESEGYNNIGTLTFMMRSLPVEYRTDGLCVQRDMFPLFTPLAVRQLATALVC